MLLHRTDLVRELGRPQVAAGVSIAFSERVIRPSGRRVGGQLGPRQEARATGVWVGESVDSSERLRLPRDLSASWRSSRRSPAVKRCSVRSPARRPRSASATKPRETPNARARRAWLRPNSSRLARISAVVKSGPFASSASSSGVSGGGPEVRMRCRAGTRTNPARSFCEPLANAARS